MSRIAGSATSGSSPLRQEFILNLIPYNPTGVYEGSTRKAIAAFKDMLDRGRQPATVRLTRGRDIDAACGQLAASSRGRQRDRVPVYLGVAPECHP